MKISTWMRALTLVGLLSTPAALATVEVSPITGGTITPLTDAATVVWAANQGYAYSLTLSDNRAIANPSDLTIGADYTLILTQDGTGTRIPTWGSAFRFQTGTVPTLSTLAGAADILKFFSDGTNMIFLSIANDVTTTLLPPSSLTTTLNLTDRVNLTWADNSSNETGFIVQRDEGIGFDTLSTEAAGATTYVDMTGSGTYSYRIKAKRGAVLSAASGTVVGSVPFVDLVAPTVLAGTRDLHLGFNATWHDNSSDEDGFVVYATSATGVVITQLNVFAANATSGAVGDSQRASSGCEAKTLYYVIVARRNAVEYSSISNVFSITYPAGTLVNGNCVYSG